MDCWHAFTGWIGLLSTHIHIPADNDPVIQQLGGKCHLHLISCHLVAGPVIDADVKIITDLGEPVAELVGKQFAGSYPGKGYSGVPTSCVPKPDNTVKIIDDQQGKKLFHKLLLSTGAVFKKIPGLCICSGHLIPVPNGG